MDCDTCPRDECSIQEEYGPLEYCPLYVGEWRKIVIDKDQQIEALQQELDDTRKSRDKWEAKARRYAKLLDAFGEE
jgi:hypothetical protein